MQIRGFFTDTSEELMTKYCKFNYKDLQFNEFLNKLWQYSQNQRHGGGGLRENQKKNLTLLGKLLYKTSKFFSHKNLKALDTQTEQSYDFLHQLYLTHLSLGDLQFLLNKGWLEGLPFYEFYKSGGLHNGIEVFNWIK